MYRPWHCGVRDRRAWSPYSRREADWAWDWPPGDWVEGGSWFVLCKINAAAIAADGDRQGTEVALQSAAVYT